MGDTAGAGRAARHALAHAVEPDLLVDLYWTLVQCVMREGRFAESLATLDQALASPGLSARHRARLLVLAARTHSQLLYQMGRWDDALAEVGITPDDLKEDGAVTSERGIAAVISFHRGDVPGARRHLAAAAPCAARLEPRLVASLALARSLDREHDGALPEALAALTGGLDRDTEDVEETEDVLGDAVRLALAAGELDRAHVFADQAAALAAGSEIPHRQAARSTAAACWIVTPASCSRPPGGMRTPAGRCRERKR